MRQVTRDEQSKSRTAATKAERKAYWYAEEVAGYRGYEVTVDVTPHAAEYYKDGSVMFPQRTTAAVHIRDTSLFGDVLVCMWTTYEKAEGHRASTRCISTYRIRGSRYGKARKSTIAIKNEGCFAREVGYLHYTAEVREELAQDRETHGEAGARVLHTIQLDTRQRGAGRDEHKRVIGREEIAVKTSLPLATVAKEADKLAKAGLVERERYSDGRVYYCVLSGAR